MKILGIIAEYNPFHKGHEYQIKKAKEIQKKYNIDVVIATIPSNEGVSIEYYAETIYSQGGYGQGSLKDGMLLLLSMEDRDYDFYKKGKVNDNMTISVENSILDPTLSKLKNNDFDVNIEELKALKDEITGLKAEIKRLNEMDNISLSSLIVKDIKTVGNSLIKIQEKAVGSIKHLYDNMKHQLTYSLTKAQEKFVEMKIGIVKGLVNSMQSFIKEQQKKLNNCLEKLDTLSKEIQKDEEKLNKGNKEEISQSDNENKDIKSSEKTVVRNGVERQGTNIQKSNEKKPKSMERKPSVLKTLKENQQKIRLEEKGKAERAVKKDKGMEI